jgi:putative transposase
VGRRAARNVREPPERARGLVRPEVLRVDNGPEFLAETFTQWAKANGMAIQYIQPGKPNQNAYIERFNRTFREEVLDAHLFGRLDHVREAAWWWMLEYNEQQPHDSLGELTPAGSANAPEPLLQNCPLDGEAYVCARDLPARPA